MFDFGNANEAQRQAIITDAGPMLITAGPGTGKTFTLVQRTIYLIKECGVLPENILIATFTEKAAKELVTRITNELATHEITANINEMYVGTSHSLCLRILKEHLEFTRLKQNYRILDTFDQQYLVFRHIKNFASIPNVELVLDTPGKWKQAATICEYVNALTEELVDAEELMKDSSCQVVALGEIMKTYLELLDDNNLMDFSSIQVEAYRLLKEHPEILDELQKQISHLMIDEYQDTNYIQEKLVFLIGGKRQNICVVGDDDQGLYRFRGATIRNILEFPKKFDEGRCKVVSLVVNYRSESGIVDFYNKWMQTTDGMKFAFAWDHFRYDKRIVPWKNTTSSTPSVARLWGNDDEDEWHEKILSFIQQLKDSGKLTDLNQIAFLFSSVKKDAVTQLAHYLEEHGINVYSPRSDMFFERREIRLALGCMMLLFPRYVQELDADEYTFLNPSQKTYYRECIILANEWVTKTENKELLRWIRSHGRAHVSLKDTTDYAYSGLLYQMFAFEPFASILSTNLDEGVVDVRPTRNLAKLSQIISKFEYLHHVDTLNASYIDRNTEQLFNLYLRLLISGGITEYEDDSEYAPSGCVSFLTIHQAKGMEFPIVFVDSLGNVPRTRSNALLLEVEANYFKRPAFEPDEQIKFFDFWRLYYTAFSRAQDLLVLTCNEDKRIPSKYFREPYEELICVDSPDFDIQQFDFHQVKAVNLKNTFSFTSHITVYETCALQYKFYKELEFTPVKANAMLFGTLVHETIENVHRAVLRKEEKTVTEENIARWFNSNYLSLTKSEHAYLSQVQLDAALKHVMRYVQSQRGDWSQIQQAEVDISLVKPDYIIEGKVDLVRGKDGTVEIVDFKSEKKPDMEKQRKRLEQYRRQLHIYAHLIEAKTGQKVSKMHLYYTGEDNGVPTITFPYTKSAVEGTMAVFDDTVHKILRKDFRHCSTDANICKNCDFRFYCRNR